MDEVWRRKLEWKSEGIGKGGRYKLSLGDLRVLEGRFWEIDQLDDVVDRGLRWVGV